MQESIVIEPLHGHERMHSLWELVRTSAFVESEQVTRTQAAGKGVGELKREKKKLTPRLNENVCAVVFDVECAVVWLEFKSNRSRAVATSGKETERRTLHELNVPYEPRFNKSIPLCSPLTSLHFDKWVLRYFLGFSKVSKTCDRSSR